MEDETLKKAHELAGKMADEIIGNFEPEYQGVILTQLFANIHATHRDRIQEAEQMNNRAVNDYGAFVAKLDIPKAEGKTEKA